MSLERKLLCTILAMEAEAAASETPNLSRVMASVGISSTTLRELLTKLFRKGYLTPEWRTTPAGQRAATRPLGQVLLRQQPTGRQIEGTTHRGSNTKTKPRKVFSSSARIPTPLLDVGILRATRNTSAPVIDPNWLPPTMLGGPQRMPPKLPLHPSVESFADVRESEVEELKPRLRS